MSKKYPIPFSHPRWNDPPIPEIIGEREITAEEEKQAEEALKEWKERRKKYKEMMEKLEKRINHKS